MATYRELMAIQQADPDGKDTEPTEELYRKFEEWVIANFGEATLRQYKGSNWSEGSKE